MNTSKTLNNTSFDAVRKALKKYRDKDIVDIYSSVSEPLEKMIYREGLRINALHFHKDLDLMIVVLNNKKTLKRSISEFKLLQKAKTSQLANYELTGGGTGIHWSALDEDISLVGLLQHE